MVMRLPDRVKGLLSRELIDFLVVGGAGYVVDVSVFNLLRSAAPFSTLDPSIARTLAVCAAMCVTYVGNRSLTWRGRTGGDRRREIMLFVLFNVIGSPDMRVEIGPALQLCVRDTVLLASDGLFDNLFIDEIVDSIRVGPLAEAADRLVERVGKRMCGNGASDQPCKPDDLTVVLFRRRR